MLLTAGILHAGSLISALPRDINGSFFAEPIFRVASATRLPIDSLSLSLSLFLDTFLFRINLLCWRNSDCGKYYVLIGSGWEHLKDLVIVDSSWNPVDWTVYRGNDAYKFFFSRWGTDLSFSSSKFLLSPSLRVLSSTVLQKYYSYLFLFFFLTFKLLILLFNIGAIIPFFRSNKIKTHSSISSNFIHDIFDFTFVSKTLIKCCWRFHSDSL